MTEKKFTDFSPMGRRLRMSTREIVVSVVLTVAALVAILVVRLGNTVEETALSKPVASDVRRP